MAFNYRYMVCTLKPLISLHWLVGVPSVCGRRPRYWSFPALVIFWLSLVYINFERSEFSYFSKSRSVTLSNDGKLATILRYPSPRGRPLTNTAAKSGMRDEVVQVNLEKKS